MNPQIGMSMNLLGFRTHKGRVEVARPMQRFKVATS